MKSLLIFENCLIFVGFILTFTTALEVSSNPKGLQLGNSENSDNRTKYEISKTTPVYCRTENDSLKESTDEQNLCNLFTFPDTTDSSIKVMLNVTEKRKFHLYILESSLQKSTDICTLKTSKNICREALAGPTSLPLLTGNTSYTICISENNDRCFCKEETTAPVPGQVTRIVLRPTLNGTLRISWDIKGYASGYHISIVNNAFHFSNYSENTELDLQNWNYTSTSSIHILPYTLKDDNKIYGIPLVQKFITEVNRIILAVVVSKTEVAVSWTPNEEQGAEYLILYCNANYCNNATTNATEFSIQRSNETKIQNVTITVLNEAVNTYAEKFLTVQLASLHHDSVPISGPSPKSNASVGTTVILALLLALAVVGTGYYVMKIRARNRQKQALKKMFNDPDDEDVVFMKRSATWNH